jgi:hypothetical protein
MRISLWEISIALLKSGCAAGVSHLKERKICSGKRAHCITQKSQAIAPS